MVINQLLKLGFDRLKDLDYANPSLEVRLILGKLLKVDKSYLYAYGDREVEDNIEDKFLKYIAKRSSGYPLQYILNEKEFMGLNFYIEEGVLVPRPDTECLVEYVIDYIERIYKDKKIKVLDMGIGSGAISLSIAKYCPNAFVYGVDIDEIPIRIANINKNRFNLTNVEFLNGNMFEPIENLNFEKGFHILASNPPYIPTKDIENLQDEVKTYEPNLALDGGEDGLKFYREITQIAPKYLMDNGLLIYEIGYDQGKAVKEILKENGFESIEILKDIQGFDRVVLGFLN